MDAQQARYFILALACSARVAGMQAENDNRKAQGHSMAYTEEYFFEEARQLENIAAAIAQG